MTVQEYIKQVKKNKETNLDFGSFSLEEFPYEILDFYWIQSLSFGMYTNFETGNFFSKGICKLNSLPDELVKLENLKLLSLGGSPFGGDAGPKITDFSMIWSLYNLEELYLDNTKILEINEIGNLTKLKHLNLSFTNVNDYSPIKYCKELTTLRIGDNNLDNIDFVSDLTKLKGLSLTTNKIKNIDSLKKLINLNRLCLCKNEVKNIEMLSTLINLKYLCVCNIEINDYSFLKSLVNLEEIGTWNNLGLNLVRENTKLEQLTFDNVTNEDICDLINFKNVKTLSLEGTFTDITTLEHVYSLKHLDLKSNLIFDLSPLINLDLDYLTLSDCPFESLTILSKFNKLKNLVITNVPIPNIEFARELTQLESLYLSYTKIESIEPLLTHIVNNINFSISCYESNLPKELNDILIAESEEKNKEILEFYKKLKTDENNV